MVDLSPLPPVGQKWGQHILDMGAAILCWPCHSEPDCAFMWCRNIINMTSWNNNLEKLQKCLYTCLQVADITHKPINIILQSALNRGLLIQSPNCKSISQNHLIYKFTPLYSIFFGKKCQGVTHKQLLTHKYNTWCSQCPCFSTFWLESTWTHRSCNEDLITLGSSEDYENAVCEVKIVECSLSIEVPCVLLLDQWTVSLCCHDDGSPHFYSIK